MLLLAFLKIAARQGAGNTETGLTTIDYWRANDGCGQQYRALVWVRTLFFNFQNQPLRVFERDGDPWFVAKDVVDGLELTNVTIALEGLDDDELSSGILKSGQQHREMRLISEPGFYKLVGRSRKPAAKRFDHWVRHEVLPTIRKTGSYNRMVRSAPHSPACRSAGSPSLAAEPDAVVPGVSCEGA